MRSKFICIFNETYISYISLETKNSTCKDNKGSSPRRNLFLRRLNLSHWRRCVFDKFQTRIDSYWRRYQTKYDAENLSVWFKVTNKLNFSEPEFASNLHHCLNCLLILSLIVDIFFRVVYSTVCRTHLVAIRSDTFRLNTADTTLINVNGVWRTRAQSERAARSISFARRLRSLEMRNEDEARVSGQLTLWRMCQRSPVAPMGVHETKDGWADVLRCNCAKFKVTCE